MALADLGLVVGPGLLGQRLPHLLLQRVRERAVVLPVQALAPVLQGVRFAIKLLPFESGV